MTRLPQVGSADLFSESAACPLGDDKLFVGLSKDLQRRYGTQKN